MRGWEEAVVDDADRRRQLGRERGRVVDGAGVVGDHAAVRAARRVAQLDVGPSRASVAASPNSSSSSGTGGVSRRRACRTTTITTKRSAAAATDLLARVRRAAALDQPAVGVDLVGAVDGDVEPRRARRPRRTARRGARARARSRSVRGRGRDAGEVERAARPAPAAGGRPSSRCRGRRHAVLDELRRRLGGQLLLSLDRHCGQRYPRSPVVVLGGCERQLEGWGTDRAGPRRR